jgi:hypothetical protein
MLRRDHRRPLAPLTRTCRVRSNVVRPGDAAVYCTRQTEMTMSDSISSSGESCTTPRQLWPAVGSSGLDRPFDVGFVSVRFGELKIAARFAANAGTISWAPYS